MPCSKKTITKAKRKVTGYTNLTQNKKYEFTDGRVRKCQQCGWNFWIKKRLFCKLRLRRFGATLWPDPLAFVPNIAKKEGEKCLMGLW